MPVDLRRAPSLLVVLVALALVALPGAALAREGAIPADLPVLAPELERGTGTRVPVPRVPAPAARAVDGHISDWVGRASRFGGTFVYSAGEYVYQDYLFDAYGADAGDDAEREELYGPVQSAVPETYRPEAIARYAGGEFGLPQSLTGSRNHGDLPFQPASDLAEVRIAVQDDALLLLARTTTLTTPVETALLVLADTGGPAAPRDVPFGSELRTERAEVALLLAGERGWRADLATGTVEPLPDGSVATNAGGFVNAVEARLPLSLVQHRGGPVVRLAVAAGRFDPGAEALAGLGAGPNVANVAFRFDEPVREWMEKRQALELHGRSMDAFFAAVNLTRLAAGVSERYVPGPGYHEKVFLSAGEISQEGGREGVFQHYGLYVPSSYREGIPSPLQWWLHWRGGTAHAAAMATPRLFHHLGEETGSMVVSPRGRGNSRWYVGLGHADFLEVWDDVMGAMSVDRNRVYLAGHSMGGFGTFLLSVLYPDRFAAGLPASPPVTQGAWTGLDFPGCDQISDGEYSPCYIQANGGNARVQHTRRLLENVRHVPLAIFHGAADELVPYPGVARQAERLTELGYRHRFYTFPTQEHYGPPVWDQWADGAAYMRRFVRPANPHRVTYERDMPFERATEQVQSGGVALDFAFDSAYWMSGLTAADPEDGVATFDGRSHAIPEEPYLVAPDAGGPTAVGQTGPYVMEGLQWVDDPLSRAPNPRNAFEATLTGATGVRLDLERMRITTLQSVVEGVVTADRDLELRLRGTWRKLRSVTVNGEAVAFVVDGDELVLSLPEGRSEIVAVSA